MKKIMIVLLTIGVLAGAGKTYVMYNDLTTDELEMGVETEDALTFVVDGEEQASLSASDVMQNYEDTTGHTMDDYLPLYLGQYDVIDASEKDYFLLSVDVKSQEKGDMMVDFSIPDDMRVFTNRTTTESGEKVVSFSEAGETQTIDLWFFFDDELAPDDMETFDVREGYFNLSFKFYLDKE